MLSLPPTWNYTIEGLSRLAKDGRDSIKTALKELENFGYLERKQIRNDNGSFCDLEYFVYEKPQPKEPLAENPSTDKSSTENPSQLSTYKLNTYKSNKDKLNTKDKDNILSGERSVWECLINEECTDQPSGQSAMTTGQVAPTHDRASCTDGKGNLSQAIPDITTEITNQRIHTENSFWRKSCESVPSITGKVYEYPKNAYKPF